jgi:1-acyl-sn-glycerol-3-phosphate acyltransferase
MGSKDNKLYLFGHRKYWPIFSTMFLGAFNDNVFKNALIILITYQSYQLGPLNAQTMVSLAAGIFILPFFLFSATAGQIADKYSKSTLVTLIKIWEVLAMTLAAIGFSLNSPAVLLFTLFFMGTQSAFFGPVKYSILPELLEDNEILSGNAYFEMGTYIAILLGTIIGGVVITMGGTHHLPVIITVITLAIIGVFTALANPKLEATNPKLLIRKNPITPTIDILKLSYQKKNVFMSLLGISWFWFLGAIILTILPVLTKDFLHANEYVVTFFLATFSIGIGIGSILCEKIGQEEIDLGLVVIGAFLMSLFLFDLSTMSPIPYQGAPLTISNILNSVQGLHITISMALFALAAGFYSVPLYTYMQVFSESGERSQIVAANNILNALFMVIASVILMAMFAAKRSIPQIFFIFAVVNTILAYFTYKLIPQYFLRLALSILTRCFYKLEVNGTENVPKQGPAIIACNHITFIDWAFLCTISKRPIRFIMHKDFVTLPLCGWFFKGGKIIPIAARHEDYKCYEDSFPKTAEQLKNGNLVGIFPEGKITLDGKINTFKSVGIERIITDTPVPVIPVRIDGLWGTFFSKKQGVKKLSTLLQFKRNIKVTIGEPIAPEELTAELLEQRVRKL